MTQERTLHLYGLISAETVAPILEEIIQINNEDELLYHQAEDKGVAALPRQPIHLYINSGGGSMYDAFSLLSVIESSETPVYTYCHGYVMSAGLTIFTAGHQRFGGQYSQYMFHEPSENMGEGKYSTMESRLAETKRIKDIRTKYICNNTKLTETHFQMNKHLDYFMDASEAYRHGIIHGFI